MTQELVSLRTQIQELQGELTKANERVAKTATTSQEAQVVTEPVGTRRNEAEQVHGEALQTGPEFEKVIATLREELRAQEALREKE